MDQSIDFFIEIRIQFFHGQAVYNFNLVPTQAFKICGTLNFRVQVEVIDDRFFWPGNGIAMAIPLPELISKKQGRLYIPIAKRSDRGLDLASSCHTIFLVPFSFLIRLQV